MFLWLSSLFSVFAANFVLSLQRLTGKTPDNLEELREMALDVEEEEEYEDTQDEDEVHTHSDSEEEASDQEKAADD